MFQSSSTLQSATVDTVTVSSVGLQDGGGEVMTSVYKRVYVYMYVRACCICLCVCLRCVYTR